MSAIENLTASLHHALLIGLNPDQYEETKFVAEPDPVTKSRRVKTGKMVDRRPQEHMCQIYMFTQMWGSTASGFGGIGGQAMTNAETVIVIGPRGDACVYFGGRIAYHIQKPNLQFYEDMHHQRMKKVSCSGHYEDAK